MISIVIPVYNEEENLLVLQKELDSALKNIGAYEVLYVDDGSTDGSQDVLSRIKSHHPESKIIELARHFGQTEAMQAGIDHAAGDILVFGFALALDQLRVEEFEQPVAGAAERALRERASNKPSVSCTSGRKSPW